LAKQKGTKEIVSNRKAFHEYFVLERFEAGIELAGTEVKSIRAGTVNLKDSFCTVKVAAPDKLLSLIKAVAVRGVTAVSVGGCAS